MFDSLVNAATWAGIGAIAVLLSGLAAERMGYLHLDLARQAHRLNITKAIPRIGCSVIVEEKRLVGSEYPPHFFVHLKIYNEGELPAQSVNGQWKLSTNDPKETSVYPIQRDFLGRCQEDPYSHRFDLSPQWFREGIVINVEVKFSYTTPSDNEEQNYSAKYIYTGKSGQTIKLSA
jgi:hypothetical protein